MGAPVGRRSDGFEAQSRLHRDWAGRGNFDAIGMVLPVIVVHCRTDRFVGLRGEPEKLVFESVGSLGLVRPVYNPVVQRQSLIDGVGGTKTHVIERQEVKPVRTGVVHLVLSVVAFYSQGAGPFAEVYGQTVAYRCDVRPVGLEDIAVNIGSRFIARVSLQSVGGLS